MLECQCQKCSCPNQVNEFGHRYEEANTLAEAEQSKDIDSVNSIMSGICKECVMGRHQGQPKNSYD